MIPADNIETAAYQLVRVNRLLAKLWQERVDMRAQLFEAMRNLRLVQLTLTEASEKEGK